MQEIFSLGSNIFKLLVAMLCGCLIGLRRQIALKLLGVPTHALIATGSCMLMLVSCHPGYWADPGKTAAHVAVGIGFLGAGIIIGEKGAISGIWTAASLWAAAVCGLAIGAGMFPEGAIIAFLAYYILSFPRE
jgi:putative Mg2+ transporter-C (MgtC) family protein